MAAFPNLFPVGKHSSGLRCKRRRGSTIGAGGRWTADQGTIQNTLKARARELDVLPQGCIFSSMKTKRGNISAKAGDYFKAALCIVRICQMGDEARKDGKSLKMSDYIFPELKQWWTQRHSKHAWTVFSARLPLFFLASSKTSLFIFLQAVRLLGRILVHSIWSYSSLTGLCIWRSRSTFNRIICPCWRVLKL